MNNYCQQLNLPHPLVKDFDGSKYLVRQKLLDKEDVNPDYRAWLDSLGLRLAHADVFYASETPVDYMIHQDIASRTDLPKINFVYGGIGSEMHWYKLKPSAVTNTHDEGEWAYKEFAPESVELQHSQHLSGAWLIQAGVPHVVTNKTDPRWCITTVMLTKDKGWLTWKDATQLLQPWITQ